MIVVLMNALLTILFGQFVKQQSLLIGYLILKLFVLMREFLNFAFQNLGQSNINI